MKLYKNSCALCGSDVIGNEQYKYFCKKCNVLFQRKHLKKKKEDKNEVAVLKKTESIVASAKSNKMHVASCHFLKKIQEMIHLDSVEQGKQKGYESCVCLRRLNR